MRNYKRTLEELKKNAVLHWPAEILSQADEASVLPLLLQTQDSFIAVLNVADKDPLAWQSVLQHNSTLNESLFLKHLMVLSDIGGEALNKLPPLNKYIPSGIMTFTWNGVSFSYEFTSIATKCSLTNSSLKVDAKNIINQYRISDKSVDVIMLILFGSQLKNDTLPIEIKEKCTVGEYLGDVEKLSEFIKRRYIFVSKLLSGAHANALGQIAQSYVYNILKKKLGHGWHITLSGSIPGVYHNVDGNETNFDIVICSPNKQYFGIEVSFQVTTNSVIERKARESESVMRSVHKNGHKICYVIDGAGNINIREHAVQILCSNSDCTVAMSEDEIGLLAEYIMQVQP